MTTVVAEMSMSLDGFVADRSDGVEHLFGWYFNGEVEVPTPGSPMTFRTSAASASYLRWGGINPMGVPVFVVTHRVPEGRPREDAPLTFVTDGVESAVAQAKALAGDDGIVAVASPNVSQQCLDAGLLDEVRVNLVPVLLGEGIRYFDKLTRAPSCSPTRESSRARA